MKMKSLYKIATFCSMLIFAMGLLVASVYYVFKLGTYKPNEIILTGAGVSTGTYTTCDNAHTITVNGSNILFDDAYTLVSSENNGTTLLSGNLGTSNTATNFVMLNDNAILCVSHIKYATASGNIILYAYTPFVKSFTPSSNANGVIEVWHNGSKTASFSDFQSAFTFAQNGDTIKLKSNLIVSEGAVLVGKSVIIEGGNHLLDKSQWASTVFAVAENAQLTINDLSIDGGATGWDIDFDAITLPTNIINFVSGSSDSDPKTMHSAIATQGKLFASNLNISNIYSTTASGSAIAQVKGDLAISTGTFHHNVGVNGGAVRLGFDLLYDIVENSTYDFAVQSSTFADVDFTNNASYASDCGALDIRHTKEVKFERCTFDSNATAKSTSAKGGAIGVRVISGNANHKYGLPFTQVKIDNSVFNNNWCANDGFAIENGDAEFTITNTRFSNNVGTQINDQSVATFSCLILGPYYAFATQIIDNCVFDGNVGAVSCIGDHYTPVDMRISNTEFKNNRGYNSVLLYMAVADFDNCTFDAEQATNYVIHIRVEATMSALASVGRTEPPKVTFKNTTFNDTTEGATDISMKNYTNNGEEADVDVYIEGETKANISMLNGSSLIVNGTLDGDVAYSVDTPISEYVTIGSGGEITGNYLQQFSLTIHYYASVDSEQSIKKTIVFPAGQISSRVIESRLEVAQTGYMLILYTDSEFTNKWDYNCDCDETLYAKWESNFISINYYDQGGVKFSGTHSSVYANSHFNGIPTILDSPTRQGFVFEGWYFDLNCQGEQVTTLSASGNYTNIVLYAKWSELVQTITLNCENFTTQQFMVYIYEGDTLVMQLIPTSSMTFTFNRARSYDKTLRICFVFGYYGKIEYTSLVGAKANGRIVEIEQNEQVAINYTIVTPKFNSNIII